MSWGLSQKCLKQGRRLHPSGRGTGTFPWLRTQSRPCRCPVPRQGWAMWISPFGPWKVGDGPRTQRAAVTSSCSQLWPWAGLTEGHPHGAHLQELTIPKASLTQGVAQGGGRLCLPGVPQPFHLLLWIMLLSQVPPRLRLAKDGPQAQHLRATLRPGRRSCCFISPECRLTFSSAA